MNSNKQIAIVYPGYTRLIFAKIAGVSDFPASEKFIYWKKQEIEAGEVKRNPGRLLFTVEDKGLLIDLSKSTTTSYTFKKNEAGKYIKFYAYVEKFKSMQQSTVFYVEDKFITDVRIRCVKRIESNSLAFSVGEKIKLKISEYSVEESKVADSVKKSIKWMIKVGANTKERLVINGSVITGDEIEFVVPIDWAEKTVVVMPYLNIPTPKICVKLEGRRHCFSIDVKNVAEYIAKEMQVNITSKECIEIKEYNHKFWWGNPFNVIENKIMAYKLWKELVAKDCIWDHKSYIQSTYGQWVCNKKEGEYLKFFYDIWSNIHYGFVGKHADFLETELTNGAGYAQIGDNNKSLRSWETWREYLKNRFVDFGDADILGGFDDPKDQQAIKIGFYLYDNHKENLTGSLIINRLLEVYKKGKPLSIEQCEQHY